MCIVKNKRTDPLEPGDVYVGRPSKWGNPFTHRKSGTQAKYVVRSRDAAVDAHRAWLLLNKELMADLHELRGRNLVCWCAPQRCHAETLLELANRQEAVS